MKLSVIILLAFSLSMDAFSLALAYGTLDFSEHKKRKLSMSVGVFHFFMPLLGMAVKHYLELLFHISLDIVTFVLFIYIGITMLKDSKEECNMTLDMGIKGILLFSLAVSIDSFTVGVGIPSFTLVAPLLFSICSALFTYIGLYLGSKLHQAFGKVATVCGGIIFILLAFIYI